MRGEVRSRAEGQVRAPTMALRRRAHPRSRTPEDLEDGITGKDFRPSRRAHWQKRRSGLRSTGNVMRGTKNTIGTRVARRWASGGTPHPGAEEDLKQERPIRILLVEDSL